MRKLIFIWFACIVVITACTILSHTSMKQSLSYHTYDEQYEVLEQAKELLNQQKTVDTLLNQVALETTNQCFIVVYDEVNAISYTNATLNEQPLTIPLTLVRHDTYHEDIYTPNETLRFATVSCAYDTGHVIVGKTMHRYDTMYNEYTNQLLYIYGVLCLVTFPVLCILRLLTKNGKVN